MLAERALSCIRDRLPRPLDSLGLCAVRQMAPLPAPASWTTIPSSPRSKRNLRTSLCEVRVVGSACTVRACTLLSAHAGLKLGRQRGDNFCAMQPIRTRPTRVTGRPAVRQLCRACTSMVGHGSIQQRRSARVRPGTARATMLMRCSKRSPCGRSCACRLEQRALRLP